MIGEVCLSEDMETRDVTHEVVVHPESSHGVVNGGINTHGTLVGVLTGDVLVHLEEIAVALADGLLTKTLDGSGEIKIDT